MAIEQEANPRLSFDGFKITREEATNLFVHHVRMAMKFYELTPDDDNKFVGSRIFSAFDEVTESEEMNIAMAFADLLAVYHDDPNKEIEE